MSYAPFLQFVMRFAKFVAGCCFFLPFTKADRPLHSPLKSGFLFSTLCKVDFYFAIGTPSLSQTKQLCSPLQLYFFWVLLLHLVFQLPLSLILWRGGMAFSSSMFLFSGAFLKHLFSEVTLIFLSWDLCPRARG